VEEFQILLEAFITAWERYVQQHSLPPEIRQRGCGGGGRKARLGTYQEKLLFILVYLKTYPLQEVLAFHFDMSQGQACQWIHILSEVLRLALGELGHLPKRDPQKVKELLETYQGESSEHETETEQESFGLDGTEVDANVPKTRRSRSDSTVARRRLTQ
jgi:hypothetical protein